MECKYINICGGCPLRGLSTTEYQNHKIAAFNQMIAQIGQPNIRQNPPVFIQDGCRRRAEMAFEYRKGKITLGFNAPQSHKIIDIDFCLSLTDKINRLLPRLRQFLQNLCEIKQTRKVKNKLQTLSINGGDIHITEAANGLDILLLPNAPLCLEHRMEISDLLESAADIVRISVSINNAAPETIAEKAKPFIKIGIHNVFIPSGAFLQPSAAGQHALTDEVLRHTKENCGNIADLFCGCGTFSYPLSDNIKNKITAVDSSTELLSAFRQTINKLTIPNITIVQKNLFKYPLSADELKIFDIIVFDPPRAGAKAQMREIAAMPSGDKPQKIIAVSCNPYTFINDAETLIAGGYNIKEITMVDQFVYTRHFELVALFEKKIKGG